MQSRPISCVPIVLLLHELCRTKRTTRIVFRRKKTGCLHSIHNKGLRIQIQKYYFEVHKVLEIYLI